MPDKNTPNTPNLSAQRNDFVLSVIKNRLFTAKTLYVSCGVGCIFLALSCPPHHSINHGEFDT